MSVPYAPSATSGTMRGHAYSGFTFEDPGSQPFTAFDPARIDAEFGMAPLQDNILDLWRASVADADYQKVFTCLAALNVGDPVRISADNTVVLALATTPANAALVGFCSYKPSTTSCFINHFAKITGTSFVVGSPVFLTDAGSYGTVAGTVNTIVGRAINSISALLFASPMLAISGYSGVSGYSGSSGTSGGSGIGTSGYSGISGASGFSGSYSGTSGASGTSGIGTSGYSGTSGATGTFNGCKVTSASYSIAFNNSWQTIPFTTEVWDTNNFHSNVTNTSRLTANVTGKYLITGQYTTPSLLTNNTSHNIQILKNGLTVIALAEYKPIGSWSGMKHANQIFVQDDATIAGDYYELQYQNDTATGSLTLTNIQFDIVSLTGAGATGAQGTSGYSGTSGFSGFDARNGYTGYSGVSGFSGENNTSGFSGYSGFSPFAGCQAYWSGASHFLPSGWSAMALNLEDWDVTNIHDTGSNTSRMTVRKPGIYNFNGHMAWPQASPGNLTSAYSGIRAIRVKRDGTTVLATQEIGPAHSGYTMLDINGSFSAVSGTYVELETYFCHLGYTTGISGALAAQTRDIYPTLSVVLACGEGDQGTSGYSGASAFSGTSGFSGENNISGFSGQTGLSGYSGLSSSSGYSGTSGYSGRSSSSGISGPSGISGYSGYSGPSGISGYSGISGPSGISGYSGISGPIGISGATGAIGASGTSGATGEYGDSGLSGTSGSSGFSGIVGSIGSSGFSGTSGIMGPSGPSGPSGGAGESGASGFSGQTGAQGSSGESGAEGTSGYSGTSAISGFSGYTGLSGTSGFSGTYSGFSGASGLGLSGYSGSSGTSGSAPVFTDTIDFLIDSGGGVIDSNRLYGFLKVPYDATITGCTLLSAEIGAIEFDIWKSSYGNFPTDASGSICGFDYPEIPDGSQKAQPSVIMWNTGIAAGEILSFYVRSSSCITKALIHLTVVRGS